METKPVSKRIFGLVVLYEMHTDYFRRALDGITDADAHQRLDTKANHVAWLGGSMVSQRFEIAGILGVKKRFSGHELFDNNKGIIDSATYPSLDEYRSDWNEISPVLKNELLQVKDEKLDESFEMMPDFKMSYFDLISFIIYREANIIGQIALWRRLLGYEAMKYM